jgi:hypothetical protein
VTMEILTMSVGGAVAAAAMRLYRVHRESKDAETWILVANMNTLLRLDLDHITGDDRNDGLCEMRAVLMQLAAKRRRRERALLERYNALVGIAIAFGEKVHGADGTVDLRAVANRRGHVQNALVIGDRIEAALGGIAEIANDDHASRRDQTVQKTATRVPALAARANGHQGRVRATTALTAIAVPASGARM